MAHNENLPVEHRAGRQPRSGVLSNDQRQATDRFNLCRQAYASNARVRPEGVSSSRATAAPGAGRDCAQLDRSCRCRAGLDHLLISLLVNSCAAPVSFSAHTRSRKASPRTSVAQVTSQMRAVLSVRCRHHPLAVAAERRARARCRHGLSGRRSSCRSPHPRCARCCRKTPSPPACRRR